LTFKKELIILFYEPTQKIAFMKNNVDSVYVEIGKQIFEARIRKGLTQEQLAEKISLKRTSITNIEKGKQQLLVHMLIKIAKELDVDVNILIPKISNDEISPIDKDKYSKKSLNWVKSALSKVEQNK
jgi:transcriptional regulator with XRE-family HTH domain